MHGHKNNLKLLDYVKFFRNIQTFLMMLDGQKILSNSEVTNRDVASNGNNEDNQQLNREEHFCPVLRVISLI